MAKEADEKVETKASTLVQKLSEIMGEVGYIKKNGFNKFHNYYYATESDVQDAVREKLSARNLIMFPDVVDTQIRETQTRKGNTEYIAKVTIEYTIEDGDSGETRVFKVSGEGQDVGDKAIYKAISGTQKYAVMKLFMIPTGDDPERDEPNQSQQNNQKDKQQQPQVQMANREQSKQISDLAAEYCKLKGMMSNDSFIQLKEMAMNFGGYTNINLATFEQANKSIGYLNNLISAEKAKQQQKQPEQGAMLDRAGNPI